MIKVVLGACLSILAVLAQAGGVAAYSVVKDSGAHGSWAVTDTYDQPAASCGYGPEFAPDYAWFRWMWVRPPIVFARDSHPAQEDSQKVSWQFKLQRQLYNSTDPWTTVATSATQRATAKDDLAAPFKALKVYWKCENAPGNPSFDQIMRGLITITWYKPGGAVAGVVKLAPTYYRLNAFGTPYTVNRCSAEATAG